MNDIGSTVHNKMFELDGIPVLRLSVAVPRVTEGRGAKRINAFYEHIAQAVEKRLSGKTVRDARADLSQALEQSRPFEPYRVKIDLVETMSESGFLTVRRRLYARLRAGTEREITLTERWNTHLGLPETLKSENADYLLLVQ